jgi:hypothetical protein
MTSILSVAAALVGVYIIFALIASHVTEHIADLFNQRGKNLYKGICALVGGAQAPNRFVDYLYDHPLIENLSPGSGHKPSYMPPRTFTLSFLDAIREFFAIDAAKNAIPAPAVLTTPKELLDDLAARVGGMPDGYLKRTLLTIMQNADGTYEGVLRGIDAFFDAGMQRVTGWYKRWAAWVVAAVSAVIVIAFNADTLAIVRAFAANQQQALAFAQKAQQIPASSTIGALVASLPPLDLSWHIPPGGGWWPKILGLVLTWFAVMLGAPFWFNVLKQIVPVRLSGEKPAAATPAVSS